MSSQSHSRDERCTGAGRGEVSLPVLATEHGPRGAIRKSKSGRRRAVVLAAVQLLLIGHILLWLLSARFGWWGGRTTTPIEPSESMEFFKHGVVNVGLIFFALALLSTLILGRWFCGWGCHIVMLQDLCGWMMKKAGIRPRPFRSRLLIYVPLILALYMFIWPAFYRLAIAPWSQPDLQWPGFSVELTTTDFWQTFAGVAVAIPFLLVCGFGAVYFLGAKGFCTYGCPYGGFFAPLDEFAVGRIRVTDACEHCGHCTAVCTSNVRVHEEVREYGMVVDPGCMKCLDCVSVCPNDALYFGFGRPAQLKGAARSKAPARKYDLTWPQEIGLSLVFLLSFLSVRGVYLLVPMLMAAGIAGVVTFVTWKLWQLLREPNVRLHQFQLKLAGSVQPAGRVYALLAIAVLLLTAHCGTVRAAETLGTWYEGRVQLHADTVLLQDPLPTAAEKLRAAGRAAVCFKAASMIGDGGIALARWPGLDFRLAWMYCCTRDFGAARAVLERAIERTGGTQQQWWLLFRVLQVQSLDDLALDTLERALVAHEDYTALLLELVQWATQAGNLDRAIEICRRRLERYPQDIVTMRSLSLLLVETGSLDEGIDLMERAIQADPQQNAAGYASLAFALAQRGDKQQALDAMARAIEIAPDDEGLKRDLEGLKQLLGEE